MASIMEHENVIILVGGKGTRLQSVVADLPKPLAPVMGRPFLAFLIEHLYQQGLRRFFLSTGYMGDLFCSFSDELKQILPDLTIQVFQESKPLGTAGALAFVWDQIGNGKRIWAMNGDTLQTANLKDFFSQHQEICAAASLLASHVPDSSRYGRIAMNANRLVQGFTEKGIPGPGWINGGSYIFEPACRKFFPNADESCSLETDVLPQLIAKNWLTACQMPGEFIDIGIPEDYRRCGDWLKENGAASI